MKIRLLGLPDECQAALELLRQHLVVVQVDGPYSNRGDSRQVRLYVEIRTRFSDGSNR